MKLQGWGGYRCEGGSGSEGSGSSLDSSSGKSSEVGGATLSSTTAKRVVMASVVSSSGKLGEQLSVVVMASMVNSE